MNNQFQTFIIFLLLIIGLSACSNSDNSKHYLVSNKNLGHLSIKTPNYSFGVVKKSAKESSLFFLTRKHWIKTCHNS